MDEKDNPFGAFVPTINPVKPTGFSDFVTKPLDRSTSRSLFERQGAYKGDSQYDKGLVYGADQNQIRAANQPVIHQVANAAAKTVPGIGLGIIENAGYIAELFSNDQDYTNSLTEFATKNRQRLEESNPNYHEHPGQLIDWKDPAWWIDHGQSLTESIGEFLVTGAAVGGIAGQSAKLLANTLRTGRVGTKVLEGAAQLGTAATLSYTEGAMSGANIYKQVIDNGGSVEEAANAASHTVILNTLLNTGLNITSMNPLFKTLNSLKTTATLGLERRAKESLGDYSIRLAQLEAQGVAGASLRKALALEVLQEGTEEQVNLFAESEGKIKGGLEQSTSNDPFRRFINKAFSPEGLLNFALGAIGGIGQTAGMELIPYRNYTKDGETSKVSNHKLVELQQNEVAKKYITTLKEDINYLTTKQKELNTAIQANDKDAINQAKEDIYNIAALKSVREGISQEFSEDLRQIATIDNITIGEDGKTEAMRLGYADDTNDNDYRTIATKKASDLKSLDLEYNTLRQTFPDKFVADEVFRQRMNVYSFQDHINKLQQETDKITGEYLKSSTAPEYNSLIEASSAVSAFNQIINSLEQIKNKTTQQEAILTNIKSNKIIEDKLLQDTIKDDTKAKKALDANQGIIKVLTLTKAPLYTYQEELKQQKAAYNNLIANKSQTEKTLLKLKDKITDDFEKAEKEKVKEQEKVKDNQDLTNAQAKKATKYKEKVGNYSIESSPDGGFDVIDPQANVALSNHPTVEEAKAFIESKQPSKDPVKDVIQDPIIILNPEPDLSYQGKTNKDKEDENNNLNNDINNNVINEEKVGIANKVAYMSVEKDNIINPRYYLNHSNELLPGAKVTIKIATENPLYEANKNTDKVPIGIYYKGVNIGYINLIKGGEETVKLRKYIIENGEVESTIIDKDFFPLNRLEKKQTTKYALPIINKLVIGRDNVLLKGINQPYTSTRLVNKNIKTGITYAVVETGTNKEIALPLDTKRLSEDHVDSIITAFKIFLHPDELTQQEHKVLDDLFEKYNIDVRTSKGFETYFKTFLYNYNLTDTQDIIAKNQDKTDKRWVDFSGNGIRYMKSGGAVEVNNKLQAKEVGKNTPLDIQEVLIEELKDHLSKMYYNSSLENLQDNSAVNLPIFHIDEGELTIGNYSQPTYEDHLKTITETNIIGTLINDKEMTVFANHRIYFSTAFMGKSQENNYGLPVQKETEEKPKEKINLAPPKKVLKSLTKLLPTSKVDTNQVTKDTIEEFKKNCE